MTLAQSREDDDQGSRDGDPYTVRFWDLVMDEVPVLATHGKTLWNFIQYFCFSSLKCHFKENNWGKSNTYFCGIIISSCHLSQQSFEFPGSTCEHGLAAHIGGDCSQF